MLSYDDYVRYWQVRLRIIIKENGKELAEKKIKDTRKLYFSSSNTNKFKAFEAVYSELFK